MATLHQLDTIKILEFLANNSNVVSVKHHEIDKSVMVYFDPTDSEYQVHLGPSLSQKKELLFLCSKLINIPRSCPW